MQDSLTITDHSQLTFDATERGSQLYFLTHSDKLMERARFKLRGSRESLRFRPSAERKLLNERMDAYWDPIQDDRLNDNWLYGKVDIPKDQIRNTFYRRAVHEDATDLIPDLFVSGQLIVSDRAKRILEDLAPGYCDFAPAALQTIETGEPLARQFYNVLVNHSLHYVGPPLPNQYKNTIERLVIRDDLWSAICADASVQDLLGSIPIFLADRRTKSPCFNANLYSALKDAGMTGLVESPPPGSGIQLPRPLYGFECVVPLDPRAQ